ncbi:MAG: hypothetical protein AAF969_03335 [Bacteroidota bacterium]
MKKYVFFKLLLILSLLGCKTGINTAQQENKIDYQVINAFVFLRKINVIEKETFKPKANDSLLYRLISPNGFELLYYNLNENQKDIDFKSIFALEDYNSIRSGFKQSEVMELNKERLLGSVSLVRNLGDKLNARKITLPVITKDKMYAFMYSESQSDGDLFCMKKENGKWVPFVVFPLWTSD